MKCIQNSAKHRWWSFFGKTVNCFHRRLFLQKCSTTDVWQDPIYSFGNICSGLTIVTLDLFTLIFYSFSCTVSFFKTQTLLWFLYCWTWRSSTLRRLHKTVCNKVPAIMHFSQKTLWAHNSNNNLPDFY